MEKQLSLSGIFLQIFQKIQTDLRERNNEPERFTDHIIKNYAKRFSRGHWTFLGPGDEKKWYGTLLHTPEGKWDSAATETVERCKDTCHPAFKSISALSRGILKKKNNRDTIHFNADVSNTSCSESFIPLISSVFAEQIRIVVNISAWQRKKREWKRPLARKESVTQRCIDKCELQEVKRLVSSPRQVLGTSLRENIQVFESLSETIRFTRVCEVAVFVHRVATGMSYKARPDQGDGLGQLIPSCWEYTFSRVNPPFAAIPGGTKNGPVNWSSDRENYWPTLTWNCNSTTQ